jgi:NADH-ubiquinone oxidoreductase chain 1
VKYLIIILPVLLRVAFFTLLERKVLGYSHIRIGPNKVGLIGFIQPISDALKLFSKEYRKIINLNYLIFFFSPIFFLLLRFLSWIIYPVNTICIHMSAIFLFCILGLSIYFLLISGWARSNKYSLLGSYRGVSQGISYEVLLILVIILVSFLFRSFSFYNIINLNNKKGIFIILLMVILIWLIRCVAECNRSPFDFSEGESELVRGFNTEFGGGLFSLIFIAEYRFILLLRILTIVLFLNYFFTFFTTFYLFLWIRASFPRLRYDFLIILSWKHFLPFLFLNFFFLFIWFYV